ncbi:MULTISPECIES: DUF4262 domain-containing protein [Saccharopolyspora]|uniref:DUF4262 domain-containing protein n=1 Tax=Saccharopolyspora cebuensis TaxID=418759 RepID=A0ABV4CKW3_9PSEU
MVDEELRKWLVDTAEREGAAVVQVAGDEGGAPFAFSVGAWRRFGKPEVVVIGLPPEVAQSVIGQYVRRVSAGERFAPGQLYEGFLRGCPVTFERIDHRHYPEYLGSAFVVYGGDDFPAVQLIVASPEEGRFPWDDDAPGGFREYQPVLTASGAPESWRPGVDGP